MRRFLAGLSLALGLMTAPALFLQGTAAHAAEPASVEELVSAVEATYASVTTLKASFSQVSRSPTMGEEPPQVGVISLSRPKKMRVETQPPHESLFVTDGVKMWIYTPADKQVIVQPIAPGATAGPGQLIEDLSKLNELFTVALLPASDALHVIELVPKTPGNIAKLRIELAKGSYEIRRLVLFDAFGKETDMAFSEMKLNASIADETFSFTPPAGANVIDGL